MAVVRITSTVQWEIDAEIRRQFDVRRQPLIAQTRALLDGSDDQFREAIAATIRDIHGVTEAQLLVVDPFLHREGQLYVNTLNDVVVPSFCRPLRFPRPIPVATGTNYNDLTSPRMAKWATSLHELNTKRESLDEEEKKFRSSVMRLLESCTTYRQALEHWPQLPSVTPRHIIERHESQTVRVKRDVVVPALNVDELNVTAVKNKLADATKETQS